MISNTEYIQISFFLLCFILLFSFDSLFCPSYFSCVQQDSHGRNRHSEQYSGQNSSRDGNHHYSQFNRNDGRNNSSDYSRNPGGYDPRLDRESYSRQHEYNSSERYGATHGLNRDRDYNVSINRSA